MESEALRGGLMNHIYSTMLLYKNMTITTTNSATYELNQAAELLVMDEEHCHKAKLKMEHEAS